MRMLSGNRLYRHVNPEISPHDLARTGLLIHGSPFHPDDLEGGIIKPTLPQTDGVGPDGERIIVPHDHTCVIATSRDAWFPLVRAFFHDKNSPGDEEQWPFTLMKVDKYSENGVPPFVIASTTLDYLIENKKAGYLYGLPEQPTQRAFIGQSGMPEVRLEEPSEWLIVAQANLCELPPDLTVLDGSAQAMRTSKTSLLRIGKPHFKREHIS